MLTLHEVVPYLIARKLVRTALVVAGAVHIEDASRRNRNFMVVCDGGPSYMIKQGVDDDGRATVACEAAFYSQFERLGPSARLAPHLPRMYGYDTEAGIVVLELCRELHDLRTHHLQKGQLPRRVATALGAALSAIHQMPPPTGLATALRGPPDILSLHRPSLQLFSEVSSGVLRLVQVVQHAPEFTRDLDTLRKEWRGETLVHGDLRWDNCLVGRPASRGRTPPLKIVDWEMSRLGDPCWDLGSVFGDYLVIWLASMPLTGEAQLNEAMSMARYPLERLQPAMRAFWRAYVRGMGLDPTAAAAWLKRAVSYGAAWLIQSAFEQAQAATDLTTTLIYQLQLSHNMLREPDRAAVALLGIADPAEGEP